MSQLTKRLTLFDLTMIAMGSMIGSGIFKSPSMVMENAPIPWLVLCFWAVGGIHALTGAFTYAELGSMMPKAGGIYVYITRIFGPMYGFIYGWIYLTVINSGAVAALSVVFATYFGYFVPLSSFGVQITAITGILILTLINMRSVKAGAVFSDLFTLLKILGIIGLIVIGFGLGRIDLSGLSLSSGSATVSGGTLAIAMIAVLWSYGGWHQTTFLAGEAKNPGLHVPRSMIIGTATVTVIYVLANLAYLFLLTPAEIAASSSLAADAVETVLGPVGGSLIALAILISSLGTAGIYTMTSPRIYYAMARDGIFFKKVAEVHPKFKTPLFAILLQSVWAMVLVLLWGTFANLITYVVFTDSIFFSLAAAGLFVLRKREPHAERKVKTPGYPVTPLIFIGVNMWLVINTITARPLQSLAGLAFVMAGIPVYLFWKRRNIIQEEKSS